MPRPRRKSSGYLAAAGTLLSREVAVLTSAIAFNFLLCLFPLVLVVLVVAEHFQGRGSASALLLVLQELIPFGNDTMGETLREMAKRARSIEVLSLLLIVWGSSGIFLPVEMVLRHAWGGGPRRSFWKSRILAFLMTIAGGFLALLSIAITAQVRSLGHHSVLLSSLGAKASAALLTYLLFFLIYRVIPDAAVETAVALRASLIAGTAWEVLKYAFVAYLGVMNLQNLYGPLAISASLLLWAYVSSLVLVLGALLSPVRSRPRRPKEREGKPKGT